MSLLNSLEFEEIIAKNNPNRSSFVFRFLPRCMGITIGNCLKRILDEYISGIAPCAVKITDKNGSVVKFSDLAGVHEVTTYLIVKLKEIVFEEKEKVEGIFCLELKVENKEKNQERKITAVDFPKVKGVEIKNPELYLATLANATPEEGNTKLEIKLYCRKDSGYHLAEKQKENDWWKEYFAEEKDIIVLDTNYSPIKGGQISFQVEPEIISINTEQEKLTITVNTNGAIKPKKALLEALEIARTSFNHFSQLITDNKKKEKIVAEKEEVKI